MSGYSLFDMDNFSMVSISDYFASRYHTSLLSFNHLSLNAFDGLTFRFPSLLPAVGFEF